MRPHFAGSPLCALGLFSLCAAVYAQTPTSPAASSFASEPYVLKTSSTVTSMNADGTGTRVQTLAVAIQSESALHDLSVLTILYSSQSEHGDFVYARVVHPDGTTQETPVAGAIQQPAPVTQQAPLYSDLETKQLPIKGLRVGDQLQWQARFTVYHTEVPGQFWGQSTFAKGPVILDESYELRVPAGLHVIVWTNPRAGAITSESDADGQHIYRWQHSDLHPTVGPEADAARKAEKKRLLTADEEVDAEKGKLPSFAWTTFPDWASVGAWYRTLTASRITPDEAIKAKVAELTAGKSTDLEKAQAVYNFVSARIRYVGVDFGIGAYQPHAASEVFANQYGDCKDKHTLLASMLSVLNLHADLVLIGAGVRFNPAVPSPAAFNHLITRLSLDGHDVWLDSTAETATWGALLKPIRDQDALVIPAAPPAVVVHTPIDLPYPQISDATVVGSLDSKLTSDSKFTLSFHDDDELIVRSVLRNVSPSNYDAFMQQLMAGMGFGGTTSEAEIDHLEDPSQPLQLSFHYHRVKEKDWGENRITAIFQPIGLPSFTAEEPPTSSILIGSPRTETSTVNLKLPDGWNAKPPDNVHVHTAFAACDVTYNVSKDHVLSAERRLTVLQPKVPVSDFKQYQSWFDDCGAGSVPYIQLTPATKVTITATRPEPSVPVTIEGRGPAANLTVQPSDPKAADLIQQAQQSARSMDLDNARKLLDQAEAINPTQLGLWSTYAGIAGLLGMNNQAWDDIQRELSYHPEEVQLYSGLAQAQLTQGNSQAALATLRSWVKAAPGSPDAALALGRRLIDLKQFAEALTIAQTAMNNLAGTSANTFDLMIVAARAQVGLGQVSQAAAFVAPLLKMSADSPIAIAPAQIDDIVRVLAEANVDLDDASAEEAKLLADAESQTSTWTVSDNLPTAMQLETRIAAEWDTTSLILFHQGKLTDAAGYAAAALHANNKDAHDHLAAINAVVRSPAAAATLRADDQHLRTFPLGPANGHQGVVFVTLLLADGKVIDSKN
jgi:tetratricopeptide (TPR) repeat protein